MTVLKQVGHERAAYGYRRDDALLSLLRIGHSGFNKSHQKIGKHE